MTLINDLINKKLFKPPEPPRDSWLLGTAQGAPSGGVVSVLIDGDSVPVQMSTAVITAADDRVLTCLLGRSRIVVANLTNLANANADKLDGLDATAFFRKAPGNTLSEAAVLSISANGEILADTNTTGSTGFPTAYGQSWLFTGSTYGRDFILHRTSGGDMYIGGVNATRDGITAWTKLWHAGNDGSGSGLDADLLDGLEATAFAAAAAGVTNGNSHDHLGGDGAQIARSSLNENLSKVIARRTTAQTMTASQYTTIIWADEDLDALGEYNASTGVFTAQNAGQYLVSAHALGASTTFSAIAKVWFLGVYVGGTGVYYGHRYISPSLAVYPSSSLSTVLDLAANDTVDFRLYHDNGSNISLHNSGVWNRMSITRIA